MSLIGKSAMPNKQKIHTGEEKETSLPTRAKKNYIFSSMHLFKYLTIGFFGFTYKKTKATLHKH
jgi:hypothetical protein